MRIPLNTTSTAKTSTFPPGPSGGTLKEVSSVHVQGMHACQVLYSQVLSSSVVGSSCSPCLLTWKPLLLPVTQWLTFQWSPLMPGGVGCVVKEQYKVSAAQGTQAGWAAGPALSPGTIPPRSAVSTDLHQAASVTSQTSITCPCPSTSLPHCQQHSRKTLINKSSCSVKPDHSVSGTHSQPKREPFCSASLTTGLRC